MTRDEHAVYVRSRIEAAIGVVGSNGHAVAIDQAIEMMDTDPRYAEKMVRIAVGVNSTMAKLESDPERIAVIEARLRGKGMLE